MTTKTRKPARQPYCAVCHELERIGDTDDDTTYQNAVNAVFDRLDRISHAHTLYGRRKGHR